MTTRDSVYIALFTALMASMAVFPQVPLAMGIPFVLQSIVPMLAGSIIGAWRGAMSMVLFLILVAIGLPLLTGGRGGLAILLGPTGGFALSWIVVAAVVGLLTQRQSNAGLAYRIAVNVIGAIIISYPIGILWMAMVTPTSSIKAIATTCSVFIPGDLIKVVVAALISRAVQRAYPLIDR